MHKRYVQRSWALLHQADVRARLEEWPRIHMELKIAHMPPQQQEFPRLMTTIGPGTNHSEFCLKETVFGQRNSWSQH